MFVDRALVRRIEAAECGLCTGMAEAARQDGEDAAGAWPVAGGAAVFAGPGSPCNKLVGLGLDRVPDEDELATAERELDARDTALRVEVSSLAGETAALLAARGYALQGFEYVLGRRLGELAEAPPVAFDIDECTDERAGPWIDTVVDGFAAADPNAPHEEFPRAALETIFDRMRRLAGFRRYAAREGGTIVAAASLRIDHGLAQLCGAATLPAVRRRGIQTALVHRRLRDAARAGCDLAVVTTAPGSKSQENLARAGFEVLYVRAIMERPVSWGRS